MSCLPECELPATQGIQVVLHDPSPGRSEKDFPLLRAVRPGDLKLLFQPWGVIFQITFIKPLSACHPCQVLAPGPRASLGGDLLKVNPHQPTPLSLWSNEALKKQFCHQHLQQHVRCHDLFLTFKISTCGCYGYTVSR